MKAKQGIGCIKSKRNHETRTTLQQKYIDCLMVATISDSQTTLRLVKLNPEKFSVREYPP